VNTAEQYHSSTVNITYRYILYCTRIRYIASNSHYTGVLFVLEYNVRNTGLRRITPYGRAKIKSSRLQTCTGGGTGRIVLVCRMHRLDEVENILGSIVPVPLYDPRPTHPTVSVIRPPEVRHLRCDVGQPLKSSDWTTLE
jgi:hypothetical protein